MDKIHVINNKGVKKEVTWSQLLKLNEDSNNDKYYHDIEWYLQNGYYTMDDVIKEFKQKLHDGNH